jgi:hypothetical protein
MMFENTTTSLEEITCSSVTVTFMAPTSVPHDYDETGNLYEMFVKTVGA